MSEDSAQQPGEPRRDEDELVLVGEVQLLLAEKRTSLSVIRTGIAVFALPLSIVSVLIATSKLYDPERNLHLLVPVLVACSFLFVIGGYLMVRGIVRIRHYDRLLHELRTRDPRLAQLLD